MRNNRANSRKMWYQTYKGWQYKRDSNGDITGDKESIYSEPVEFKASLSATRGTQGFTGTGITVDYFGVDIKYSLIISTCNMKLPIDEYTLIWTHTPDKDGSGNVDVSRADYRVTAVARGQRHMKYAIKERAMNEAGNEYDPTQEDEATGATTSPTQSSGQNDTPSSGTSGTSQNNDSIILMP